MGVLGLFDDVADEDKALRRREAFYQHVKALEAKDPQGYRGGVPVVAGVADILTAAEALEGEAGARPVLVRLESTCIFFRRAAKRVRIL